jgi:hypothetical protein
MTTHLAIGWTTLLPWSSCNSLLSGHFRLWWLRPYWLMSHTEALPKSFNPAFCDRFMGTACYRCPHFRTSSFKSCLHSHGHFTLPLGGRLFCPDHPAIVCSQGILDYGGSVHTDRCRTLRLSPKAPTPLPV